MISDWQTSSQAVDSTQVSLANQWQSVLSAHPLLMSGIMGCGEYVLGGFQTLQTVLWPNEQLDGTSLPVVPPDDIPGLVHQDGHYISPFSDAVVLRGNMPNQVILVGGTVYAVNPQDLEVYVNIDTHLVGFTVNLPSSQNWLAAQSSDDAPDLVIQDASGNQNGVNITINAVSPDTINGHASRTINVPYSGYRLRPLQNTAGTVTVTGPGWIIR